MIIIILTILQARMSSTRLPGKVLKPLLGEPMLYRQIERIMQVKRIDELVIATSNSKDDDQIEELCIEKNLNCYRGSLDNVLDRFYHATIPYNPDYVMRLTGDCPLFDPGIAEELIDFFLSGEFDYASNTIDPTYPDGLDIEIMKFSALKTAWEEARLPSEKEHVTPYIINNPKKFKLGCMKNSVNLSDMRWTVDEPEDFVLIEMIYSSLYPGKHFFNWEDTLKYLNKNPEIAKINSKYERNEGYKKSLEKDRMIL